MIAFIALIALVAMYYIVGALNRTTAETNADRTQRSLQSLQEAKQALIAYSASQAWSNGSTDQPGSLPCPAADDNGAIGSCTDVASTRVGRLPWKGIGATQLRDASGAVLWYALSANFRKLSGTKFINSDTQGTLALYDDQNSTSTPTQSNIVAVIIAPGPPVALSPTAMQNRTDSSISNYLDCRNATLTDAFSTSPPPVGAGSSCPHFGETKPAEVFNDQMITITQAELMAAVEPAVAARITRDIVPDLQTYVSQWGRFPYPASFTGGPGNPGTNTVSGTPSTRLQSAYVGDNTMTDGRGLLPISNSVTYPWVAPSGTPVTSTGGTSGGISSISCASISTPISGWQCSFTINAVNLGAFYFASNTCLNPGNGIRYQYCIVNPAFTVAGDVSNAGLSIAKISPTTAADVTVTSPGGTTRNMSAKSISWTLKSDGSGRATFTLSGTHSYNNYSGSNFTRTMVVRIPDRVTVSPMTGPLDGTAGWFIINEWYRQIYYVVSPGYLPDGTGTCSQSPATPSCLAVSGLSTTSYPSPANLMLHAILIMGGYSLNSSLSRPQAALSAYFEGINATPGGTDGYSYQHHTGLPTTTNDRVIVIAP